MPVIFQIQLNVWRRNPSGLSPRCNAQCYHVQCVWISNSSVDILFCILPDQERTLSRQVARPAIGSKRRQAGKQVRRNK